MATFTITTPTFVTALTGKTGGDTYNINGGSLTIDCDTRYAPNATAATGPMNNLTVDSALGGNFTVTTEFTKLVQFNSGVGLVPAYGTTITQGAASGVLLCVMETRLGGAVYAAGGAMPATGWLKLRVTAPGFTAGLLTGIVATAVGAEEQGWIVVVGQEIGIHNHPRLGTMQMRGDWIDVGTTNGATGQTLQLPHFTADGSTYYPGVDVETAPGSGLYQFWPNAGLRHTSVNSSTDTRSSFVFINTSGVVYFGIGSDASVCGYVPASGCKVRVPSINLQNCTSANRSVNVEPTRSMGNRYESTFTNAGLMNVSKVTGAWYWNVIQAYSVYIRDLHTCDQIILGECATAMDIDNLHAGLSTGATTSFDGNSIVIQQSYNGGNIGTISWLRAFATATSGYAAIFVNLYGGWTANKLRGGQVGAASALSGSIYLNTSGTMVINELVTFTKRVLIQAADNCKIIKHIYADNNVGTTTTTAQSRAIETVGQCKVVDITDIQNWPGVANCHPYLALMFSNTTQKATLRNCGTAAIPYNAGTVNGMAYIWDDGGNNDVIKIQRNWTTALRLGLHGGTNTTKRFTSVNNYQVDASKTIGPQQLDSVVHGNRFNSGGVPTSYAAVYGNAMWDGFTGDTTTRAALILVEKSAANPDAYQITGGTPKFNGAGRVVFQSVGDQITWTWPWRILGWSGLTSFAASGANTANHLYEYALDIGAGFGPFKTMTNGNLAAETGINPVTGLGMKMRITCTVANVGNRIDSLRIDGVTTLAQQNVALYPLDVATLSLSGLQAGSSVAVFAGVPTPGQAPLTLLENSPTSAVMSYDYDPLQTICTVRIRKPGFGPIDLQYTNVVEAGFPISQVENKDGFGDVIYGRGPGSTDAFITPDGPALRIDVGNALCAAEDVYDVVAAWQATPTGMLYPEALRFDGRDMLLIGLWRLRRALAAYTNAGIDAAVIVDGMTTASPDDEVNGSVDIRAKAVRTYSTSGGNLTPADVAAAVWAFTLSTGNPAESELLATKTAASNAFAVSA